MVRRISTTDTAKAIREELKKRFPKTKFSVRSKSYSGGSSIDISWIDGAGLSEVDAITKTFAGSHFDLHEDMKVYHDGEYKGEAVSWGADYVSTSREYSLPRYSEAAEAIAKYYGLTPVGTKLYQYTDRQTGEVIDGSPYIVATPEIEQEWFNQTNRYPDAIIRNKLAETSFEIKETKKVVEPTTLGNMTGTEIFEDTEGETITVKFPSPPDEELKEALNDFRFSYVKAGRYWKAVRSESTLGFAGMLARLSGKPIQNAATQSHAQPLLPVTDNLAEVGLEVSSSLECTITENEEKDGVELRFGGKPSTELIDSLKAIGFRAKRSQDKTWFWYAKRTEATLTFAYNLTFVPLQIRDYVDFDRDGNLQALPSQVDSEEEIESDVEPRNWLEDVNEFKLSITPINPHAKTIEKFRQMADGLSKDIQDKLRDRPTHTHRMARHAASAYSDGYRLQKVQTALLTLATAMEDGSIFKSLEKISTKNQVEIFVGLQDERDMVKQLTNILDATHRYHEMKRAALARMGVTTLEQFCDSVSDFMDLLKQDKAHKQEQSREQIIREIELKIAGREFPGYFPTPKKTVGKRMVELAMFHLSEGEEYLEPSAGKGNLADLILAVTNVYPLRIECQPALCEILAAKGHTVRQDKFEDFTRQLIGDECRDYGTAVPSGFFDRIIMNPPWGKETGENYLDISHILLAYSILKPGGRMVAIASESSFTNNQKTPTQFRDWLTSTSVNAYVEKVEAGAFMDSDRPTGVSCRIVLIQKPKN